MTYSMSDLKKGLKIELNGTPFKITEYQHVKPGKGAAFVRVKMKSFIDGKVIDKTFHAGDKCEEPNLLEKDIQFLYFDGESYQFMDNVTYEQVGFTDLQVSDAKKWLLDGMNVKVLFFNEKPITVTPPTIVEMKILETPPNFKGDTASGGKKPATLESGAVVQVPYHVVEGDIVKINTETEEYQEKVK